MTKFPKQLSSALIACCFLLPGKAQQTWQGTNFYDIQKGFYEQWKDKKVDLRNEANNRVGGGWHQFKRWEHFAQQRVYPSGNFPDPGVLMKEYDKVKMAANKTASAANWVPLGPSVVPSNGGSQGRINCIRFHPTNQNIFWIGAANGGLWKTTNGGASWSTTTDLLPNISIADIAIDPLNPNNMYVATGDGYGYAYGSHSIFWGGVYTAGILKLTDGGTTWAPTGLSYTQGQTEIIQSMALCPAKPNILLAATRNGIHRSTNGGTTWNIVQGTHVYDIVFNTANPAIVYASFGKGIYRSLDTGATWSTLAANLSTISGRLSLAVTAANSQVIYAWCSDGEFFRSSDGGATFQAQTSPDGDAAPYGYYDRALNAAPGNANVVYAGGLELAKSTDGGITWTITADWVNYFGTDYVHADKHVFEFFPGSTNSLLTGTDGGIFKTTDGGATWTDLSNGLNIPQYYRLGCSAKNANITVCGQQDNGVVVHNNGAWSQFDGLGDGMECVVDYQNPKNIYFCFQGGDMYASYDGGLNFISNGPFAVGDWIAPFMLDPFVHSTIYAGYEEVYVSLDSGTTWGTMSSGITSSSISVLMVAPSNNNYLYAGTLGDLNVTKNAGSNWTDITAGLPVSTNGITGIAVNYTNPQHAWVCLSGYNAANKVFMTTDAGTTWTNVTNTGLPNVPLNCIIYEKNTPDALYVGTDIGVYYTNKYMNTWIPYNTGLPNVIVDDLEIHYGSGKIRAATYGRGLWESNLNNMVGIAAIKPVAGMQLSVYPNPSADKFQVVLFADEPSTIKAGISNLLGEIVEEQQLKLVPGENRCTFDMTSQPEGVYFIRAGTETKKVVLTR